MIKDEIIFHDIILKIILLINIIFRNKKEKDVHKTVSLRLHSLTTSSRELERQSANKVSICEKDPPRKGEIINDCTLRSYFNKSVARKFSERITFSEASCRN